MHLEGTKDESGVEEGSEMERKNDVSGLFLSSANRVNGKDSRQPVDRRPAGLTIRVRGMDCLLEDIQAQIQMLRRERTYLRLVRGELAGMEATRRGSSPSNTSLK
jgi:hypothetical protein